MRPDTDRILVELVLRGDKLAFGDLIARDGAKSLQFAARIVGSRRRRRRRLGCASGRFHWAAQTP